MSISNFNMLSISIIIPTLNRPLALKSTIGSILLSKYLPLEIIVIDQSEKNIYEQNKLNLKKLNPNIEIIHHFVNFQSSTKARNLGINLSKGDILLFCDDDIEIDNLVLFKLVKIFYFDSNISLIGAYDYENNRIFNKSILPYFIGYNNLFKLNEGHINFSMRGVFPFYPKKELLKTNWAMGFFFALRREYLIKFNIYFDEKLSKYAYSEDLDFTYRYIQTLRKHNMRAYFYNKLKVFHKYTKEFRDQNYDKVFHYYTNRLYLIKKLKFHHFAYIHFYFFNLALLFKFILKPKQFFLHLKAIIRSLRCNFDEL